MAELDRRNGTVGGKEGGNTGKPISLFVVPQPQAVFGDSSDRLHVGGLHADDPGAADGARRQMGEMPVIGESVARPVLAHGREHDPVLHLHRAERDRPEQMRIGVAAQDAAFVLTGHRMLLRSSAVCEPIGCQGGHGMLSATWLEFQAIIGRTTVS
jgi:hypothetical protein